MAHSNQLREFVMTSRGIKLIPAYVGPGGVLTGSSRLSQEAKEKSDTLLRQQESQRRQLEIRRRRVALQAQIASLQSEFEAVEQEARQSIREEEEREEERKADVANMVRSRRSR
jgi:circadian clock protein KaiC